MKPAELRSRFQQFAGEARYRKFVRTLNRASRSKGRLLHWQKQLWDAFVSDSHQSTDNIFELFGVCDVHECRLQVPAMRHPLADIRDTPEYEAAFDELFPLAINGDWICIECRTVREKWIADHDGLCRILRCKTTYEDYCDRRLADIPNRKSFQPKIKQRAAEIAEEMLPGDELWEWDAGGWHRLSGTAGVAIVRNGEIVKQWCEFRS